MKKRMTKKQAYKIATRATKQRGIFGIGSLTRALNDTHIYHDWTCYWVKINTSGHIFMTDYFKDYTPCPSEEDMLYMLTLCMFIEDTYK